MGSAALPLRRPPSRQVRRARAASRVEAHGAHRRAGRFNKHLDRELVERPLRSFEGGALRARIDLLLAGGVAAARSLFRDVERAARASGFSESLDGWEPDLAWLRGDAAYRD